MLLSLFLEKFISVSYQPERKEKDCLNCGTIVQGRYCQQCGQENIVTRQSFWSLIKHFVYDILHFDGKFFDTLKGLLLKPGWVPYQYASGKRQSFLDPIRMYLFTSAVFFLVFFAITKTEGVVRRLDADRQEMSKKDRLNYAGAIYSRMSRGDKDTTLERQLQLMVDTSYDVWLRRPGPAPDYQNSFPVRYKDSNYLLVANKAQEVTASVNLGSNWLERQFERKWGRMKEESGGDSGAAVDNLLDSLIHKFPYMLFLSLPFFAMILKLIYIRRKNYYYSDHAVFTLYHYIISFILMLLYFFLRWVNVQTGFGIFRTLGTFAFLAGGIYLFIAMKRFYRQSLGKTIVKFLVLNLLALLVLILLMFAFIFLSIIEV